MAIYLEISNGEGLLKNVGSISSSGQSCHGGQVTTVATHGLNDKHPAFGACCRLLNSVTSLERQGAVESQRHKSDAFSSAFFINSTPELYPRLERPWTSSSACIQRGHCIVELLSWKGSCCVFNVAKNWGVTLYHLRGQNQKALDSSDRFLGGKKEF